MWGQNKSGRERHTIGKVAVHSGAETPNIFAMSVAGMPFSRGWRALAASASPTLRGRPPLRPLAAAAASPARVRSIMVSRSSWAKATMMVSMALPIGPSVCRPSVRLRNPIPREVNWSTTASNVLGVASEAVQFPDGEHVAFAEVIEVGVKLRSASRVSAVPAVRVRLYRLDRAPRMRARCGSSSCHRAAAGTRPPRPLEIPQGVYPEHPLSTESI